MAKDGFYSQPCAVILVGGNYPNESGVIEVAGELLKDIRESTQLFHKEDIKALDRDNLRKISQWNQERWLRNVEVFEKVLSKPYPSGRYEFEFVKELLTVLKELSYQNTNLASRFFENDDVQKVRQWYQDRWLRIVDVIEGVMSNSAYPLFPESLGMLQELLNEIQEISSEHFVQDMDKQEITGSEQIVDQKEKFTAQEWYEQGKIFQELGDLYESIRCYVDAIRLNPDLADAFSRFEIVRKDLQYKDFPWQQKKWNRTIDALERILTSTTYPHDPREMELVKKLGDELKNIFNKKA